MKNKDLFNLSKERLYFIYQQLKSDGTSDKTLESIQFFDKKPSELLWETYISNNESKVISFDKSLHLVEKYRNYEYESKALEDLNWFISDNKMFFLFYDKQNCILFRFDVFTEVIVNSHFFSSESYLLYCFDNKRIITGGWQGFSVWEK